MKRYGVEHPSQNIDIFNKQQKAAYTRFQYKDTNLHYQGTYELDFLDKYSDILTIKNGPSIKYLFENSNKTYYSDFYIPNLNLIVEIKSSYTYKKYLEKNIEKQKSCIEQGYNFIFIINKDYTELDKLI